MAVYLKVISSSPLPLSSQVPVDAPISVEFSEDIDPATITTSTFLVAPQGGLPIPGQVTYTERVATFIPASDLSTGTVYQVTIVGDQVIDDDVVDGVRSILGHGLPGNYTFTFVTVSSALGRPVLLEPADQSAVSAPTFSWTAVPGADYYEIEVATEPDFIPVYWPLQDDNVPPIVGTTVTPAREFDRGQYWVRVRARAEGLVGDWSQPITFYCGDVQDLMTPLGVFEVSGVFPDEDSANLTPQAIIIDFSDEVDATSVTSGTVYLVKVRRV